MVLRLPPCLPTGAYPLYTLLRHGCQFLVGCCLSRCRSVAVQRQQCILYIFFHRLNLSPQTIGCCHPTHSNPHTPPLQHLSYRGRQQLFDCCIFQLNGGHLRPRHHFPSIFLMHLNFASQTGEPAIAPPNPITGALRWARGRPRGAIGWWLQ